MPGIEHHTFREQNRALSAICAQATLAYSPGAHDSPVQTPKFLRLLEAMVRFALPLISPADGALSAKILSAGMRSVVVEVARGDSAIIVKHFRRKDSATNSGGFGYLREKHGLVCLNRLVAGSYPCLYASDDNARFLACERISGHSVAETLLGSDRAQAIAGLNSWQEFWKLQLTSPHQESSSKSFAHLLARSDTATTAPGALTSPQLARKGLKILCAQENIPLTSPEYAQKSAWIEEIINPNHPADLVLSSGDFSPHNLLLETPDRAHGIDAEGTAIHHRALPVAEMLLGFPSSPKYPNYHKHFSRQEWIQQTQTFYEHTQPKPLARFMDDDKVRAAVLTLSAIRAEQLN